MRRWGGGMVGVGSPYNLMKSHNVIPAELARKLVTGEGKAVAGGAWNSG